MNERQASPTAAFGGILIPFEMFRITALASVISDTLAGKARNIVGSKLVISRHPSSQLLMLRIEGPVVNADPPGFWRENADLVLLLSQVLPRQCVLMYGAPAPGRREGFVVAQQGQVLMAEEASEDTMPAGAAPGDWPLTRLLGQMHLAAADIAEGFPGGPRIEVDLAEPRGDDQALLMTLAGQNPAADAGPAPDDASSAAAPGKPGDPAAAGRAARPRGPSVEEDLKRRAQEQSSERAEHERRAEHVATQLRYVLDDLGAVVAPPPPARLDEPELLRPFLVARVGGDLPPGIPRTLSTQLQGKRVDFAVPVEFLSEVFLDSTPVSKVIFEQQAEARDLGGRPVRVLEVLAPRLGHGTLVRVGSTNVFVSRRRDLPLPAEIVLDLLGG